jgi:hypothetical protein
VSKSRLAASAEQFGVGGEVPTRGRLRSSSASVAKFRLRTFSAVFGFGGEVPARGLSRRASGNSASVAGSPETRLQRRFGDFLAGFFVGFFADFLAGFFGDFLADFFDELLAAGFAGFGLDCFFAAAFLLGWFFAAGFLLGCFVAAGSASVAASSQRFAGSNPPLAARASDC